MMIHAWRQPLLTVVWIKYPETTIGARVAISEMPLRRPPGRPLRQWATTWLRQIRPAAKTSSGATQTCRCWSAGCSGWLTTAKGSSDDAR